MKYKYNQEYKKELKETIDQLRALLKETKPAFGPNKKLSDIWTKTASGKKSLKELIESYKYLCSDLAYYQTSPALLSSLTEEAESIKEEIGLFIELYDILREEDRDLFGLIAQAEQKLFIAQHMSVLSLLASAAFIILTLFLI